MVLSERKGTFWRVRECKVPNKIPNGERGVTRGDEGGKEMIDDDV